MLPTTFLIALSTLSLVVSSPFEFNLGIGLHKRQGNFTSTPVSPTSLPPSSIIVISPSTTVFPPPSSSTLPPSSSNPPPSSYPPPTGGNVTSFFSAVASSPAPTTTPSAAGSAVDQATSQIIAGLRAASDGVRSIHGVAATTNNSAVEVLSNIASAELVLAGQGIQAIYQNILNGFSPNAGGANPEGQLGAALISLNGTTLAFPVAVSNSTPELTEAISAAQQGTVLALSGATSLAVAEGLSGIIGVNGTVSSPSALSTSSVASSTGTSSTLTSSSITGSETSNGSLSSSTTTSVSATSTTSA
ncbi:hypothetical protein BCR35DRAFT_332784 [Leucosporidium creatinivorum]|uniref:Uncharacterized protein n=1 Tax=Leucosporidium creatinivorum TaxID=106004 RepID=A0A1Y2F0M9_9BASI|nr:hypothetical protein BCR35DRAFT_332784 [Leucosporidium creatinivorum]